MTSHDPRDADIDVPLDDPARKSGKPVARKPDGGQRRVFLGVGRREGGRRD